MKKINKILLSTVKNTYRSYTKGKRKRNQSISIQELRKQVWSFNGISEFFCIPFTALGLLSKNSLVFCLVSI
jgi:hypothetical protein